MALPYFPRRGEVLICDFDTGFQPPEMVKKRPVVVLSLKESHSRKLCTVVPFSTTAPMSARAWHHPLTHVKIPGLQPAGPMWAKCDMLATVGFDRLNKPYLKTRHGRSYQELILDPVDMRAIEHCICAYLGLKI
jgi:uncharacterized protein YifN (PemK superfamily)